MENVITRQIEIKAPVAAVWSALTDAKKFARWFKVKLDGPFEVGKTTTGQNTHPGYEHLKMNFMIVTVTPQSYFAYRWTPYPADPEFDYDQEPPTLVEFHLEATATGTLLKVTESGFNQITASRRAEAFRMHSGGWESQLKNIGAYVEQS